MSFIDKLRRILGSARDLRSSNEPAIEKPPGSAIRPEAEIKRPAKRPIELTIGLDFGTAFTKVVVGEQRKTYAIPFQTEIPLANAYLLPCVFSVAQDGVCTLGEKKDSIRLVKNLKMRLLDGEFNDENKIEIATFLAIVIRHSMEWLLTTQAGVYRDRVPDWYINIGLPTDSYHNHALSEVYRDIAKLAWSVSLTTEPITMERAAGLLDSEAPQSDAQDVFGNHLENPLHADKIGLFPEFVAQITGYVRSPNRQPDLHALVDIGAGTVDITTFNVHEDRAQGEHLFPIFAKKVEKCGVNYLSKHRREMSGYSGEWHHDASRNALNDIETAHKLGITPEALEEIDKEPKAELRASFMREVQYTKDVRHPHSPKWKEGVPLFLCGGGSRLSFYSSLFNFLEENNKNYPLVLTQLPKPDRLEAEGLPEDEYDRLSVAYGLSFSALDIGTIRTADQVDDIRETLEAELTMCRRCNGTGGPRGNDCVHCGGGGFVR